MRSILVILAALTTLAATSAGALAATSDTAGSAGRLKKAVRLHRFATCEGFLHYAKGHALERIGPWGIGTSVVDAEAIPVPAAEPAAPAPAEEPAGTGGTRDVDYSGTNVQEEGVDEPDLVKTDGSRLFALANGKLWAVDVSGAEPRLLDSLALDRNAYNQALLLRGNRLLVLAGGWGAEIRPLPPSVDGAEPYPYYGENTVLTEVDVGDPARLRVARTLTLEGNYLSARLVGASARVVITSPSPVVLPLVTPESYDLASQLEARRRNRRILGASGARAWLPRYALRNARIGTTRRGNAVQCDDVRRPQEFSGLGMLSVLTIDLDHGLKPVDSDAIMTSADTVYASPTSLYVATQRWIDWAAVESQEDLPERVTSVIHKFDIADPHVTAYRASGVVPGHLLNQWSMSEKDGLLRVASTDVPTWWGGVADESESVVTVLADQEGKLVEVGRVGGLGKGERIYAVRFIGDVGYVVTFRQTDPLYTIDLSDPARPAVLGALKILGYSAYLHPIGDDLLLGVGQDATEEGRVRGTQLSVFDIANLAEPTRLFQQTIKEGWSEAEWDHHAFLWWPQAKLTVIPVATYRYHPVTGALEDWFVGAVGFRVDRASGIQDAGALSHRAPRADREPQPWLAQIRRALVIGDALYTLSEAGVEAASLATFEERAWVPFGETP